MVRRRIQSPAGLSIAAVLLATLAIAAFAAAPPNLSKAIEAQRRLVAERPQDASVHNDLGSLLLFAERPVEAEAAYRRALELDPNKVSALFNLAQLQQQRGEMREALRLYERVVESQPNHAWAHYQIGACLRGRGERAAAIESFAEAFRREPRLAFPDVNPDVIANPLLTESLLEELAALPCASSASYPAESRLTETTQPGLPPNQD